MLFDVQMPGTVLGHITPQAALATHFPAGLPVVRTTSDKPVEALGAGLLDDETAVISWHLHRIDDDAKHCRYRWRTGDYASIPQTLLYEGYGIRKGMWTVSWLRDMLGESLIQDAKAQDSSPEDFAEQKSFCVPPGCNGLMTVLDRLTNPWEPYKRGIMIGFDSSMDYAWIYRSILESVALTLKNNYDNMCNEMNYFAKHVIITGGGSNSDLFMQIFADVFNLPAQRNAINGCEAWGSDQYSGRSGAIPGLRNGCR